MKLTNEELIQIIKEELESVIDEKKGKKRKAAKKKRRKKKKKKKAKRDACYHKVRSRYDVWPSAYASGALVKCRKVGAKNWGNSKKEGLNEATKDDLDKYTADDFAEWYAQVQKYLAAEIKSGLFDPKKEEAGAYRSYVDGYTTSTYEEEWLASKGLLEEFEPHDMYDPETGEKHRAKKKEDHVDMAGKGFVHVDPDELRDILDDEGGAAGLDPMVKGTKSSEEEVEKALSQMPDVGKHEKGDYIKGDKRKIRIVKEAKSYSITLDVMKDYVKLKYPKKDLGKMTNQEIKDAYHTSLGVDKDEPSAKEFEKMGYPKKNLKEAKNCGCGKNPCKTYGRQ